VGILFGGSRGPGGGFGRVGGVVVVRHGILVSVDVEGGDQLSVCAIVVMMIGTG
jgi:hypothetical protein